MSTSSTVRSEKSHSNQHRNQYRCNGRACSTRRHRRTLHVCSTTRARRQLGILSPSISYARHCWRFGMRAPTYACVPWSAIDEFAVWRYTRVVTHPCAATFTYRRKFHDYLIGLYCAVRLSRNHFVGKCLFVDKDMIGADAKLLQILLYVFSAHMLQFFDALLVNEGARNYYCLNFHIRPFFCLDNAIGYRHSVCIRKCGCVEWKLQLRFLAYRACCRYVR